LSSATVVSAGDTDTLPGATVLIRILFSLIKSAAADEIRAPAGISISFLPDLTMLRTCSANMKTDAILVPQK
jgi:hypothetical protein